MEVGEVVRCAVEFIRMGWCVKWGSEVGEMRVEVVEVLRGG